MTQVRLSLATTVVCLFAGALASACGLASRPQGDSTSGFVTGGSAGASSSGDSSGRGGSDAGVGSGGGGAGGGGGAAPSCSGLSGLAGDFDQHISVDGTDRRFLLHVPPMYDPEVATRLIVALHGFTEGPEDMRDTSHFDEVADQRGFLVAYPEGLNGSWNGGTCCGLSMFTGVDDVAFITAVLDAIAADYCVDPAKVHATGFSNGGFMTERLGCELSDRIASIGVVAGEESLSECNPTRPMPVLEIHGTADPVVPYDGDPFLGFPSTSSTVAGWTERDGCPATPTALAPIGDTTCDRYDPCHQGATVELCTVDGGAHEWPGGGTLWVNGMPPDGFVATFAIADFFEAHPRP